MSGGTNIARTCVRAYPRQWVHVSDVATPCKVANARRTQQDRAPFATQAHSKRKALGHTRAAGTASIRAAGQDTQSSSTRPKPSFCLPQIRVPGVWHLELVQLQAVERGQG